MRKIIIAILMMMIAISSASAETKTMYGTVMNYDATGMPNVTLHIYNETQDIQAVYLGLTYPNVYPVITPYETVVTNERGGYKYKVTLPFTGLVIVPAQNTDVKVYFNHAQSKSGIGGYNFPHANVVVKTEVILPPIPYDTNGNRQIDSNEAKIAAQDFLDGNLSDNGFLRVLARLILFWL